MDRTEQIKTSGDQCRESLRTNIIQGQSKIEPIACNVEHINYQVEANLGLSEPSENSRDEE